MKLTWKNPITIVLILTIAVSITAIHTTTTNIVTATLILKVELTIPTITAYTATTTDQVLTRGTMTPFMVTITDSRVHGTLRSLGFPFRYLSLPLLF